MRKIVSLLLILTMLLSLCACSQTETGKEEDSTKTDNSADTEMETPEPDSDPAETGDFHLLTVMTNTYLDGDEMVTAQLKLVYDENYDLTGIETYENGVRAMSITCDKVAERPLTEVFCDDAGNVQETTTYSYDEKGNELGYTTVDVSGELIFARVKRYNEQGLLEETVGTDAGGNVSWERYTYDDQGNELSYCSGMNDETWTDITYENIYTDGVLTEVKTYKSGYLAWGERFDADGNTLEELYYADEDNIFSRHAYTYENGKLVRKVFFDTSNDVETETNREEYCYDQAGHLVEIRYIHETGSESNTVFTYESGHCVNIKAYDVGELELETTLTYEKAAVSEAQVAYFTELYALLIEQWR